MSYSVCSSSGLNIDTFIVLEVLDEKIDSRIDEKMNEGIVL